MMTFRRRLAVTPMLIGIAVLAIGLPASAQAVYQHARNEVCCEAQGCCTDQSAHEETAAADHACCPEGQPAVSGTDCCSISEDCCDQSQSDAQRETRGAKRSCLPSHDCCPGARSELGGYL